jgi:hypothetical protein
MVVERPGNDLRYAGAKLLSFQFRGCAATGGFGRVHLQQRGLQEDCDRWRGLFLRVHAGVRTGRGILSRRGAITKRLWFPLGTKNFASIIAALPDDVDAIYLGPGGGDALNFLNQYQQASGTAKLVGGTLMVDQTVLAAKGNAKEALAGTPGAGPHGDTSDDPQVGGPREGLPGCIPTALSGQSETTATGVDHQRRKS